jgi:hypothetical protein
VLDSAREIAIVANGMDLEESAMTEMQRRTYQKPTLSKRDTLSLVVANAASGPS